MKRVSIDTARKFLKDSKANNPDAMDSIKTNFSVDDSTFEVEVKGVLSIAEKTAFIRRVTSACFGVNGDYHPEYVEPMIKATLIQMCTNMPTITIKGEKMADGGAVMDIDAMAELYDALLRASREEDFGEQLYGMAEDLEDVCRSAISWELSKRSSRSPINKSIVRLIDTITDKVDNIDIDDMMSYASRLSSATEGMESGQLAEQVIKLATESQPTSTEA